MWLRDRLPLSHPRVRFMVYGHPFDVKNPGARETVDSLALWLVQELRSAFSVRSSKPMIIFAHSFRGVVLKHVLAELSSSMHAPILDAIRGVVFFGVPNKFVKIQYLHTMIADSIFRTLAQEVALNSAYLKDLDRKVGGISMTRHIRLYSAYEQSPTRLLVVSLTRVMSYV